MKTYRDNQKDAMVNQVINLTQNKIIPRLLFKFKKISVSVIV